MGIIAALTTIDSLQKARAIAAALLLAALAGSCGGDPDSPAPQSLPVDSLPGVYTGVFPCDGCPGIESRLWLRADGRFFFEQRYPADEDRPATAVYGLGRWALADDPDLVNLDGKGPRRIFARVDSDTLEMQTHSDLEHRLSRDAAAPSFTATVHMEGTVRRREGGMEFTECLTGYSVPVSRGADFSRFQHQYRSVGGQSDPTYVELEGRFAWAGDGAPSGISIERFITIKAGEGC